MTEPQSSYIHYLPPIFQESSFLDGFLLAFEKILSQSGADDGWEALETVIAHSHTYLKPVPSGEDPRQTPDEFLPWLASWVALTLREDWPKPTQRQFIREIVGLYLLRGTKAGMTRLLKIYLGEEVPISILDHPSELGFAPPAYFFQVQIAVNTQETDEIRRIQQIAQAIIEQEKPAHTFYGLQILVPTMRLLSEGLAANLKQNPLILGRNTLLGTQQV
ncbi:MAG: phage tail protein I [Chloroflexi bacterium]|nr:phage tail protein I [Chloroflexota bacterium]